MPWGLLHRYVFAELLRVFVLALVGITAILVLAGVVAEASQQGVGPVQVLKLIPLLIPGTLPFTVPATTLFAVSVTFGRMAADNEITALKSAGIPITKVLWPALVLGATLSGGMVFLYSHFIPHTVHLMRAQVLNDVEELIYTVLKKDLCFNQPGVNYKIWVKEVQGRRLIEATFKKFDAQGRVEIIAQAAEAEIKVDLAEEVVHVHMRHGEMSTNGGDSYAVFNKEILPVPLPPIGANRRIRPRELSNPDLLKRHAEVVALKQRMLATGMLPVENPDKGTAKTPDPTGQEFRRKLRQLDQESWQLESEYQMRPAMALSCFFFVLIGCPVAIWFHKRDYLSAFVTCFLPIVVVYYPLMMFGINLGKEGKAEPVYAMWVGNAALGLTGLMLTWRLVRR